MTYGKNQININKILHHLTPPTQIGYKSCCGNFFAVDVERVEGIGGLGVAAIPNPWVVIK